MAAESSEGFSPVWQVEAIAPTSNGILPAGKRGCSAGILEGWGDYRLVKIGHQLKFNMLLKQMDLSCGMNRVNNSIVLIMKYAITRCWTWNNIIKYYSLTLLLSKVSYPYTDPKIFHHRNYRCHNTQRSLVLIRDSFTNMVWLLIPAWISDYIHYNVWEEITYPFPNFNGCTVEV